METARKKVYVVLVLLTAAVMAVSFWLRSYYLPFSFLIVFLSLMPFFIRFERKKVEAEEIVLIAVLAALAAVSRAPFASLPGIQPTSFVVIATGLVFGPEAGFMVGSASALVSNFILGQGPWTPWQMFGWGLMGLTAGLLKNETWMKSRISQSALGFIWGFLFGWIMNLWFVIGFFNPLTWQVFLGAFTASFYFDLAHALSNVFFISLFFRRWQKILIRAKVKFGVLK